MSTAPTSDPVEPPRPDLRVRCVTTIEEVDRAAWDALEHEPSPFLSYGFLRALELSGSVGRGTGWHPFYVLAEAEPSGGDEVGDRRLIGAVAAFVKSHSYGEYIFDWAWAGAAQRAGLPYYPKLVVAAPLTPATGRRLLLLPGVDADYVSAALVAGVHELAEQAECSSVHWLFCTSEEQARLAEFGFAPRASFQFHWSNPGYRSWDDFLGRLMSRKRKQLRKERRRAREALDGPVRFVPGGELGPAQFAALDRYYRKTVYEHGGMDYLQPGFFEHLARELPEAMLFAQAERRGRLAAGALFLETTHGLYGRYWGCEQEVEFLHFETAYYAGIERCIERGTPLFEAGAQGEHKLLRGFMPAPTYSAHWMRHPGFHDAISQHLENEAPAVTQRMRWLAEHGPYRRDEAGGTHDDA
ncbi:GNAT family N-acetyltransferase [Haliangium sp.]|uniref:GNAT family N-acetyltransferase n=1 Tax=Haliangium sp. TaxID=2663208 RepID=UPI003D0D50D9